MTSFDLTNRETELCSSTIDLYKGKGYSAGKGLTLDEIRNVYKNIHKEYLKMLEGQVLYLVLYSTLCLIKTNKL